MDIRQIDDEYSVSGQITLEELDEIKALGFKSIVCHRPDHESPDQTSFSVIEARAKELGLNIAHVPVGPMGVTEEAVQGMVDALDEFRGRCSAIAVPAHARRRSTRRPTISVIERPLRAPFPALNLSAATFHSLRRL